MEEEQTIKNPDSIALSLTQTAKGHWYVDRLTANGGTLKDMLALLDELIKETNTRLNTLNKGSVPSGLGY